ncbi:LOW QUALITY PROTEIN: hypothetical protein HID58_037662 [Brassica napus]|uniref:protein disulfide-isomerase n=1 Tax=Brassica napus TaxID=3708 RepID=A0ABQ8BM06_BRANA|nr:LOW QUALITY PROTEIN: hypothetical protein HID58_037662 [Brassica napus]
MMLLRCWSFPKLAGPEFDSFLATAEKLRSDYDLHTPLMLSFFLVERLWSGYSNPSMNCLLIPRILMEKLEKFVKESSIPLITVLTKIQTTTLMLSNSLTALTLRRCFINFTEESAETLKSKYREVVHPTRDRLLLGELRNSQGAFQYLDSKRAKFLSSSSKTADDKKYLKTNVEVDQIGSWIKTSRMEKCPLKKISTYPTENNEPVKVVLSLDDMVFNSGKNVCLNLCTMVWTLQKAVPILDEVAVSYQNDPSVVIAKLDATANDSHVIPRCEGFPTIYFRSASGNVVLRQDKEDFISFIDKNKDTAGETKAEEKDNQRLPRTSSEKGKGSVSSR